MSRLVRTALCAAFMITLGSRALGNCPCDADVVPPPNGDGTVGIQDVLCVGSCAGGNCACCGGGNCADVNCDGTSKSADQTAAQCMFNNSDPAMCCPKPELPAISKAGIVAAALLLLAAGGFVARRTMRPVA